MARRLRESPEYEDDPDVQKRLLKGAKALSKSAKIHRKRGDAIMKAVGRTGNAFWYPEGLESMRKARADEKSAGELEDIAHRRRRRPTSKRPTPREMP